MKHLLNNMSSEEKNNIREQHTGGIKIGTSRFKSLLESTLGDAKPLVNENDEEDTDDMKADSLIDMEEIIYDIKTTDCEGSSLGNMSSMGVDEDEDGNIVVFIRYCKGDDEELEYLKRKARKYLKMTTL